MGETSENSHLRRIQILNLFIECVYIERNIKTESTMCHERLFIKL